MTNPTPLEEPATVGTTRRKVTIGVPASSSPHERRFPLTPEGAAMLAERGFEVRVEAGAASVIHFPDDSYRRAGARIVNRAEALDSDIVLHLPAVSTDDARRIRKGAVLMGLFHLESQDPRSIRILLERHVIAIALDLVADSAGHLPFADILSEVDGRAAMAVAASLMADSIHGKGILLGGVSGIVPCEVTITGSGIAARAAARSALGLGATVRMFDNDLYRLRDAALELGERVITSSLHPKVFASALRSADIVLATPTRYPLEIGVDVVAEMKRGVITFDLARTGSQTIFPSLDCIDLAFASAGDCPREAQVRTCYVNAGSAVPRTAAMALSTTLMTVLDDIMSCDGVSNAIKLRGGLQRGVYTFLGRAVHPEISRLAGVRYMDINIFLDLS